MNNNIEYMEKFRIIEEPSKERSEQQETIEISPEELDKICSLEMEEKDKHFFDNMEMDQVMSILMSLAGRNLEDELPISEKTFVYQRNIQECKKLKESINKFINIVLSGKKDFDEEQLLLLLEDASKLLVLEKRKVSWLEKNYYPSLYRKSVDSARGETTQFLIKQKNLAHLDEFADIQDIDINLKDELTYLIDGNDPQSAGVYKRNEIDIRIPEYYTSEDEWKVYLVAIHELLHYASYQDRNRIGMHQLAENPDHQEINEGVTEILSYVVAKDHLEKLKTPLEGENRRLSIGDMAYDNYTYIIKTILPKIPLSFFTDAMLNEQGLDKLSRKFDEVFKDKNSLVLFSRNLKNLYTPHNKRTHNKRSSEIINKGSKIIDIKDYKKEEK